VIQFQKAARPAAVSVRSDKRALTLVAVPNGAPDVRRDVTRSSSPRAGDTTRTSVRGPHLLLFELGDQGIQCSVEDLRDISGGQGVAQQGLRLPQLVPGALRDRHLDEEAL
jgi:hypothetical protein